MLDKKTVKPRDGAGAGTLENLDPRTKIVCAFFYVFVVANSPQKPLLFLGYGLLILALAFVSKKLRHVAKNSATVLPFVFFIGVFLPFSRPDGTVFFATLVSKALLSAAALALLAATTSFPELMRGFEKLGMPRVFVMLTGFLERYRHVFAEELRRMSVAKNSRSAKRNAWEEAKTLSKMLGVFFVRAYERAERVYSSMLSRGFSGETTSPSPMAWENKDFFLTIPFVSLLLLPAVFL